MEARTWILTGLFLGGAFADGQATPVPIESRLVVPEGRGVASLETIRILTRWDAAGYSIAPDLSGLDGGAGGSAAVVDSLNGSYLILYTTAGMEGLAETTGIVIPITATDPSDGSSFQDLSLLVCRRHLTSVPVHLSTSIQGDSVRFKAGDSLLVRTRWRASPGRGFRVSADYGALVPDFRESEARTDTLSVDTLSAELHEITYRIAYKIPGRVRLVPERNGIPLAAVGRDSFCTQIRSPDLMVDLRTSSPPSPVEHRLVSPVDRGVRDADTVTILSRWDAGGYALSADFTQLDGGSGGPPAVIDSSLIDSSATGSYLIRYSPGPMGGFPDQKVPIGIRAVDSFGDSFTDYSLEICRNLNTPPPVHIESWIRDGRRKFRGSDSLVVYSRWTSPAGLPLTVEADFRNLVPAFETGDATVSARGVDTFLVLYRIPAASFLAPDGERIPLTLLARDSFCSVTRYEGILIDLDTDPPPSPPTFDPLPAETNTSPIVISGTAVEATRVAIFRNDNLQFKILVGENDRFETEVDLEPGTNKLGGYAEDDIGNKTIFGANQNVLYVVGREVVYPTPLRRGDEIVVKDALGMNRATVQIYNLEGDVVASFQDDAPGLEARFAWDGKDRDGDRAQPGYYLLRVRSVPTSGKIFEEVLPLLYRND